MKNLTAHYNIYFNARALLEESEKNISSSYDDDFSQLLAIFPLPEEQSSGNETEKLNEVIKKANTIALEKYESNWLDDSYLLLADAEYLKGDFYNAVEYYSYVGITFPEEKKNKLLAYLGQVKSDFALNNLSEADSVLGLATSLNYKYYKDQLAASKAQIALSKNDVKGAIAALEIAIEETKNKKNKTRWRYILAQLQETNGEQDNAYNNYDKIAKSNAAFDMSFNANLSRIRISEGQQGKQFDKLATLKRLLKEDKNEEFKEQIYFEIANTYREQKNLDKSTEFYQNAAHTVPSTAKQKGLSYLKLAEINFEDLKNYTQAQLYYDSTLQYLPKNYPNYKSIAVKANNLQYLADRLIIIEQQKKLLMNADLSDKELDDQFLQYYKEQELANLQEQSLASNQLGSISDFSEANKSGSSFYFYNNAALTQGLLEFKKKWGNRKLSDNWRVSSTNLISDANKNAVPVDGIDKAKILSLLENPITRDSLKIAYLKNIPFNPASKQLANDKIANALYEIAIFYKDVLKDNAEAAEALEAIVLNYPDNANASSIYYQLYRLLENIDPARSESNKNQLLQKFPNSIYAKTISDPNYGKEEDRLDGIVKAKYAQVYDLYLQKKYPEVLQEINSLRTNLGSFRKLDPQVAYLEALAIGNTEKVPAFLASLNGIVSTYPDDSDITPIVKQQIDFIANNRVVFDRRPTALVTDDENGDIISGKEILIIPKAKQEEKSLTEVKKIPSPIVKLDPVLPEKKQGVIVEIVYEKPKGIVFSNNLRQRHMIVIDITDPKTNIAQPFSKLSQYFYSKFDPATIKLLIRIVGQEDKFVIVSGDFYSIEEVQKVADELNGSLPEIMEGLTNNYKQFVISETNLKLLTDRNAVQQYLKSISEKK
ncbi:MAG: tetratricopeptide repeat protein [Pelobium sp.]